ncbi:MAG: 5-oxoprolinase subunit PxpA [Salinibacterium amurskyense]
MAISVNADMGESVGIHHFGNDEPLLEFVDSINVAGGLHAGDPTAIARIVARALDRGVTVGAHPGLPDIAGFGRREMAITTEEARDLIRYQTGAVAAFVQAEGHELHHIKPHGALFGMLARNEELMHAACDVAVQYGVPLYGLAGTAHERVAAQRGVPFVAEYYVDLDYTDDGMIVVNRTGAVRDLGEVADRASRALREGTTISTTGHAVPVRAESFCVHSDLPNAVEVARTVRAAITQVAV